MLDWNILKNEFTRLSQNVFIYLQNELQKINSGRVNPNMFNHLKVDAYGQETPLIQLANISAVDARQLIIKPYDNNLLKIIVKTIAESEFKVNPIVNDNCIRIIFSPLTEETRNDAVKKAKEYYNTAVQKMRIVRQTIQSKYKKNPAISDDDVRYYEDQLNKLTKSANDELLKIFIAKEKKLLTI